MALDEFPDILKPMRFHGVDFEEQKRSNLDLVADCPFCGKEGGFVANYKTGQWTCHSKPDVCGRFGNAPSFLKQFAAHCHKTTSDAAFNRLSKARGGFPAEVWKRNGMGWNPLTERWMIPVYTVEKTIQDIRVWTQTGRMIGTPGKSGLWNIQKLAVAERGSTVYICEGEWDGQVWEYVLERAKHTKFIVVAVPGAKVFKAEWAPYLESMNVVVLGDNDSDGDKMAEKIWGYLAAKSKSIKFINWPSNFQDKWDIRDQIIEYRELGYTAKRCVDKLLGMTSKKHRKMPFEGQEDFEAAKTGERVKRNRPKTNPSFQETLEVYKSHLTMTKDLTMALTAIFAVHISSRWPEVPLWMHLVGAPSTGKTALLMSMFTTPDTVFESAVSEKQLISGFSGKKDPSLIPKLIGKCGIFKDWTEMLSDNTMLMEGVNKILRGAYDGHAKREFGNGEMREYHGTFNIVTGVTNKINCYSDATVGERFLKFQLPRPPKKVVDDIVLSAMLGISDEKNRNKALQDAAEKFLDRDVDMPDVRKSIDIDYLKRGRAMADMITRLRATVEWKGHGHDRELAVKPDAELPTRLAKQLTKFSLAVMVVLGKKKVDDEIWAITERVVFNTGHGFNLDLISAMMKNGEGRYCFIEDLCETTRMPRTTMDRRLEDMRIMGLITKTPHKDGKRGRPQTAYSVVPSIKLLWNEIRPMDFHIREAIHARKVREYK